MNEKHMWLIWLNKNDKVEEGWNVTKNFEYYITSHNINNLVS